MYILAKVDGLGPCCAGTFCYSSLALSFLISYPEYSISSHKSTVSQLLTEVLQCAEKNSKQLGPSLEKYIARNNKWCGVTFVAVFTMLLCWASAVSLPTETLVANYLYALLISHNNNNAPHPWIQNSNQPEKSSESVDQKAWGPPSPLGLLDAIIPENGIQHDHSIPGRMLHGKFTWRLACRRHQSLARRFWQG